MLELPSRTLLESLRIGVAATAPAYIPACIVHLYPRSLEVHLIILALGVSSLLIATASNV